MQQNSTARLRASFPFPDLPADVQLQVISNMDLHTLRSVTQAVLGAKELFLKYPTSILQGTTARMGHQIRNLLLTTNRIVSIIKSAVLYNDPDLFDMEKFLVESLDIEAPTSFTLVEHDPLGVLHELCEIDAEVSSLVHDYAEDVQVKAWRFDNASTSPPSLQLSSAERHRVMRAFYRLKLFGVLYYNYADCFKVNLETPNAVYFARLCPFEIDELAAAYQFAMRENRYFKAPYVHVGCQSISLYPWTNSDPFNCPTCRGFFIMPIKKQPTMSRPLPSFRRSAEQFWSMIYPFIDRYEPREAKVSDISRSTPIKLWPDVPETNRSSAGWTLWKESYDMSIVVGLRRAYVNNFRMPRYCF